MKQRQAEDKGAASRTPAPKIEPFVCTACGMRTYEMLTKLFHTCRPADAVGVARTRGRAGA